MPSIVIGPDESAMLKQMKNLIELKYGKSLDEQQVLMRAILDYAIDLSVGHAGMIDPTSEDRYVLDTMEQLVKQLKQSYTR